MEKTTETTEPTLMDRAAGNAAYVRKMDVSELDPDIETPEGLREVFALHDADGQQLALFDDAALAVQMAESHDLKPHSLH